MIAQEEAGPVELAKGLDHYAIRDSFGKAVNVTASKQVQQTMEIKGIEFKKWLNSAECTERHA